MTARGLGILVALFGLAIVACSEEASERRRAYATAEPPLLLRDLPASSTPGRSRTVHVVYVPAYSRVLLDSDRVAELTVSLSVRNTDDRSPIELTSIRFYASGGQLVREFLDAGSVELAPMATATQPVAHVDRSGGEGANFIVEWTSAGPVTDPIIEAVMIGVGMQGLSFVSRGIELRRP